MAWRLAKSLEVLRDQINKAYPNRSKKSDGTIGDAAHASRKSDHNPWVKSNGLGVVTAIDITHDPANGVDGHVLSRQLADDPRTKYVIYNFQIYRSYKPKLGWASYSGTNPHVHHVHLSVRPELMDQTTPWPISGKLTLRRGDRGEVVKELQQKLLIEADGIFGYGTENAVKKFQQLHGLKVDGAVGAEVWGRLKQQ